MIALFVSNPYEMCSIYSFPTKGENIPDIVSL